LFTSVFIEWYGRVRLPALNDVWRMNSTSSLPMALGRLQAGLLEHAPGPTLMSRDNIDSMRVPNVASGTLPGLDALGITAAAIETVMPAVLAQRR